VYGVDPGLVFALSASPPENLGQRLEQAVYLELRRRYPLFRQISYYLTEDRREVDFVLGDPARKLPLELIQVCVSLKQKETRERELGALTGAMNELKLQQGTIITLYEQEEIKIAPPGRVKKGSSACRIRVVPAWKWFLE
jgi:predicted AAA+ superfamily ATPase